LIQKPCSCIGEAFLDLSQIQENCGGPRVLPLTGTPKGQLRLDTTWLPIRLKLSSFYLSFVTFFITDNLVE
jgi:hypothetical protein